MKRERTGFTLVELLTVLAIIALLVALLTPALNTVRNAAKEASQRAQLTSIDQGLLAFRNDYGDYPPSNWPLPPAPGSDYCGAQKLAEALLGWDLMGFHPDSGWRADGMNAAPYRDGLGVIHAPGTYFLYDPASAYDMGKRKGRYLDLATTNAFRLGVSAPGNQDGLFQNPSPLAAHTFVLCDVFGVKRVSLTQPGPTPKTITSKAGTPILYYRANTTSRTIQDPTWSNNIYNVEDNLGLIGLGTIADGTPHPLNPARFYQDITDPKVTARPWPHRPDSYILISAGADGEYGTADDICNFGK